jgi:membrane protein DedA with SNARE-associated domain
MLDQVISAVASWIVEVISAAGYFGVVILMAIESACIPLPSEVIMPFAGYLASIGQFSLVGAATMGALGCNLGSTVAYYVAAKGGRKAFERWGSYVLVHSTELDRGEKFFARYGAVTVFIGRLLPMVRTFIAFPAGLARMPMMKFQIYTFLGSWPWCYGLAYAGYLLGARWNSDPTLRKLFHESDAVIVAVLAAGIAWFIWSRRRETRPPS